MDGCVREGTRSIHPRMQLRNSKKIHRWFKYGRTPHFQHFFPSLSHREKESFPPIKSLQDCLRSRQRSVKRQKIEGQERKGKVPWDGLGLECCAEFVILPSHSSCLPSFPKLGTEEEKHKTQKHSSSRTTHSGKDIQRRSVEGCSVFNRTEETRFAFHCPGALPTGRHALLCRVEEKLDTTPDSTGPVRPPGSGVSEMFGSRARKTGGGGQFAVPPLPLLSPSPSLSRHF